MAWRSRSRASILNFVVARILLAAGRRYHSITLEADAHHLMTDVWTSAGVLVGIGAVMLTGWERLDPIIALLVAANIIWTGVQLVRRSALGLLDTALPGVELTAIRQVLERHTHSGLQFHALRTRQAGARRLCPCMCWCRVIGLCIGATCCWSRSNTTSALSYRT